MIYLWQNWTEWNFSPSTCSLLLEMYLLHIMLNVCATLTKLQWFCKTTIYQFLLQWDNENGVILWCTRWSQCFKQTSVFIYLGAYTHYQAVQHLSAVHNQFFRNTIRLMCSRPLNYLLIHTQHIQSSSIINISHGHFRYLSTRSDNCWNVVYL